MSDELKLISQKVPRILNDKSLLEPYFLNISIRLELGLKKCNRNTLKIKGFLGCFGFIMHDILQYERGDYGKDY